MILIVLPGSRKLLLSDSSTHFQFKVPFRTSCFGGRKEIEEAQKMLMVGRMKNLKDTRNESHRLLSCY